MQSQEPTVSVVVCTFDRSRDCGELLSSLDEQTLSPAEILVVDSGSSPEHASVLQRLCGGSTRRRYVRVDKPGLSVARNAAAKLSSAEWIAYIDDDAVAANDWYEALLRSIRRVDTAIAVIGGRVVPIWPHGVEGPTSSRWRLLLSCIEDPDARSVSEGGNVCGANLAIRRDALNRVGGFPLALGRIGNRLISGEECYVIGRLAQAGMEAVYEPTICVGHKIPPDRLTRNWVAKRAYYEGVTRYMLHELGVSSSAKTMRPARLAIRLGVLWCLKSLPMNNADWLIRYSWVRGALSAQLGYPFASQPARVKQRG